MFVQEFGEGEARLVTSASDLTAASRCEFAFLRRLDERLGRDVAVPDADDPMLRRAAELGDAHELRVLEGYRDAWGSAQPGVPGGVAEIPRPRSMAPEDLEIRQRETVRALADGADVVFQATFFEPVQASTGLAFVGFADFLVRRPCGAYEVQDAKLARRARSTALLQLAAYAEQIERLGIRGTEDAVLLLGNGSESRHRIADIAPVFRRRRLRLGALIAESLARVGTDGRRETAALTPWDARDARWCGTCEVCLPELERTRDPLLIAGIRRSQRDALREAGFESMEAVAGWTPEVLVADISPPAMNRLAVQARAQTGALDGHPPPVVVSEPEVLAGLPAPDPGDLFFDFEGDPMYREPGAGARARWGIDYLFGMVDVEDRFTGLWAHTLDEERQALLDFLALVRERRARNPTSASIITRRTSAPTS